MIALENWFGLVFWFLKKRARWHQSMRANEGTVANQGDEQTDPEEKDAFHLREIEVDVDAVKEGKPNIQDLLSVIKRAELEDALPQAMQLLELAVVTPLTSVHCERVFSRMKRVVSPSRSRMLQKRKEMLVFLQVEHKTLRWLSGQNHFKENVIARFNLDLIINAVLNDFLENDLLLIERVKV